MSYARTAVFLCLAAALASAQSITFNCTPKAQQNYTVPPGVTAVMIQAFGAQGGPGDDGVFGGEGGSVTATVSVTPGEILAVFVGCKGGDGGSTGGPGGFNGGAKGGNGAGGGGGASDVRQGGSALANRIVAAGGGGGGGGDVGGNGGVGGNQTGGKGADGTPPATGGSGGTPSSGGMGGAGLDNGSNGDPLGGNGGAGGASGFDEGGGGGGGGFFGGGGGGGTTVDAPTGGGGGGGGSSFAIVPGATFSQGVNLGNGSVTITPIAISTDVFQVNYTTNLQAGDSSLNISNTGSSGGNICANVYVFDPSEEMVSCCSCLVTPNALQSLSVQSDLISNTLSPSTPQSVVIKVLASAETGTCSPSSVTLGTLEPGLRAWGTKLHALPTNPVNYGVTETDFLSGGLSLAELNHLTSFCGFINSNGSGFGICKSCRAGGLGGAKQ